MKNIESLNCSQWGDSLFVFIQMGIVISQILYFDSRIFTMLLFMAACFSTSLAVVLEFIPLPILTFLQASTIFVVAISKVG